MEIYYKPSDIFGTTDGTIRTFIDEDGNKHAIYKCDIPGIGAEVLVFQRDLEFEGIHFPPETADDCKPSTNDNDDGLPI